MNTFLPEINNAGDVIAAAGWTDDCSYFFLPPSKDNIAHLKKIIARLEEEAALLEEEEMELVEENDGLSLGSWTNHYGLKDYSTTPYDPTKALSENIEARHEATRTGYKAAKAFFA